MSWFETWFDSKYYHILYKDRSYEEAENFIITLTQHLNLDQPFALDLACGKGRHSIHLNKLGWNVEGCDYSKNSIDYARQFSNETLHFFEHDMRNSLEKKYDIIVNLFTSFGYFETDKEHEETLKHIYDGLQAGGLFVMDFLNTHHVLANLVAEETVNKDGIDFHLHRSLIDGRITKTISFNDGKEDHRYQEEVRGFTKKELLGMLQKTGFEHLSTFGSYDLAPFETEKSKRLILILKKPA